MTGGSSSTGEISSLGGCDALFGGVEILNPPIFGKDPFNRAFEGGRNDGDGGALDMPVSEILYGRTDLETNEVLGRFFGRTMDHAFIYIGLANVFAERSRIGTNLARLKRV